MIRITIDNTNATEEEIKELKKVLQLGNEILFSENGINKARSMNLSVEIINQSAKDFIKNVKEAIGQE